MIFGNFRLGGGCREIFGLHVDQILHSYKIPVATVGAGPLGGVGAPPKNGGG